MCSLNVNCVCCRWAEDSALAPCPKDLMAALARWPKKAKPTAALMACLQRALRPGEKIVEGLGLKQSDAKCT